MTRWTPQGGAQRTYQGDEGYGYPQQQPQYSGSESNYGEYNSGDGYNRPPPNYQQAPYGGENQGYAQSYYGSNSQPYQQYPANEQYGSSGYGTEQYAAPPGPPPPHMRYQQQPYGAGQEQSYPPYGQQDAPQGSSVANFKSHLDQPNGPIDPSQPYPPQGTEEDRGLMGALAGGAAGAYGGHKVGHGIIGGIGGAVAGSMMEDAYKKHRKEKKQRRNSNDSSSSHSSNGGDVMEGNFHASSRDVHLEGRCTLVAHCANHHGHHHRSTLDLNDCFTNTNGRLEWARGGNFAASARDIRLIDDGNGIECELGDGRGGWIWNRRRLNERITNDNGRLKML